MKKFCFAVMCLSAILCCTMGLLFFSDALNPASANEASLSSSEHDVTIKQGDALVLPSEKDAALIKSWSSSDEDIVSVDSGGRIDALKQGEATVTAKGANGSSRSYSVTVESPAKKNADVFSTAYTANQDILKKNLSSKNKSKLPYQIMVNRSQNCVTVYTYDSDGKYTVPVRAMVCSCGIENRTRLGFYNIYFRTVWNPLVNDSYGQYVSGFDGDYLFHSVPYNDISKSSLKTEEYNKLGTPASRGCVRMASSDCKWVYDNCPGNTAVVIYDDDNPGPLGKPESIHITDLECQWDPTDDNEDNPYNGKTPQITGAEDVTLKVGESFDPAKDVAAFDTCGNDITEYMEIIGNPVTTRAGTYKVTYSVTDVLNRSAKVDITVTVE